MVAERVEVGIDLDTVQESRRLLFQKRFERVQRGVGILQICCERADEIRVESVLR